MKVGRGPLLFLSLFHHETTYQRKQKQAGETRGAMPSHDSSIPCGHILRFNSTFPTPP
jgi:hypothetical protein